MEKPDNRIIEFIRKHHVLTLATSLNGQPWCANCFYAYLDDENVLIFTSDDETRHISEAVANPKVAGSIVLETEVIGKIQGAQFEGILIRPENEAFGKYKLRYLKRFPYAVINNSPLWVLELTHIKFTDNRLGFGKKLFWKKEEVDSL
ncbi:MAG: pyridoxamine 5'-phosphate oxidase family protein [Bacteroidota bacterium]|nr:pyridoxamine 5'-phosphate oxidase family protein [Bacteroidota bacterium]